MKIGFLIIDMQAVHVQDLEKQQINQACEYINHVSETLRSKGHVIIHVQDVEGMTDTDQSLYETIPEIQIMEEDLILTKEYSNAFWETDIICESLERGRFMTYNEIVKQSSRGTNPRPGSKIRCWNICPYLST